MKQMRRGHHFTAIMVLMVGLLVVQMLACNFDFKIGGQGEPSIHSVTLARRLDDRQRPVEPTTVFEPTDAFFCSVEVANLETGSQVTAKWFYDEENLDRFTITTDTAGSGYLGFNLSSKDGFWPVGDYRVEIDLDNVLAQTARFSVKSPEETPPSQAQSAMTREADRETATTPQVTTIIPSALPSPVPIIIVETAAATATSATETATSQPGPGFMGITPPGGSPMATTRPQQGFMTKITPAAVPPPTARQGAEGISPIASPPPPIVGVTLAQQIDESQKPVQPTNVFEQTDTFFCSVEVFKLEAGSQITAKWYHGEENLDQFTLTTDTAGSGHLGFNLSAEDGMWPIGDYKVEIELNNVPVQVVDFSVKSPDEAIPSRVKSAIMTRSVDDNYKATEPILVFAPTDTIHCSVNADLGIGSQLTAKWYKRGELMEEHLTIVTVQENMSDTYVDFYLAPSNPLAPGPYAIEVLLNGQLTRAIDFTVGGISFPGSQPTVIIPTAPVVLEPSPAPAQAPTIGPINFSTEGLTAQQPIIPRISFPGGTKIIYATLSYSNFLSGDIFEQIWYLNEQESGRGSFAWADAQRGQYQGSLNNTGGLLPGNYRLGIKLNGQLLGSGQFVVESAALPTVTPGVPTQPLPPTATGKPEAPSRPVKIVYTVTEGDVHSLWTMNLDGTNRALITDHASDPSWAPDGNSIMFYGWNGHPRGANGIYEINSDGTNARQLWNQGSAEYLDWCAAGRYIAMNTVVAGTSNKRLVIYDESEGQWRDIGPGEQPAFSPDGNSIVARTCVGSTCGLFIMGRYGDGKRRLTNSADDAMPSWSPTGDRIVYSSQQNGNWDIWVINPDGSGQTQLTRNLDIDAMPIWLPDSSGIVYRSTRDGAWGIWVMDADGTNARKLINAPAAADWGRDRLDVY